jgi:3-methylfumaryl-CoA hydratase
MQIDDTISETTVARLAATLDLDRPAPRNGDVLPLGWHGAFCIPAVATSELGPDGIAPALEDPALGAAFPRRVFGGARITQHAPLHVGDNVRCRSEVVSTTRRSGASGEMVVLVLRHRYAAGGTLCIEEEQDIVHLPPASGSAPLPPGKPAPSDPVVSKLVTPSSTLLFRFSALTFNTHRIHYDAPYATGVEGLPALMVQGKLQALLAMGLIEECCAGERVRRFVYRSFRPIFADGPFSVAAGPRLRDGTMPVWTAGADGFIALSATAEFDARSR